MACINRNICPFLFRKSYLAVFCKKGVPKNFANFTGKDLCQSVILIVICRPEAYNFKKRDSGTGFFLSILQKFCKHLFL